MVRRHNFLAAIHKRSGGAGLVEAALVCLLKQGAAPCVTPAGRSPGGVVQPASVAGVDAHLTGAEFFLYHSAEEYAHERRASARPRPKHESKCRP